MRYPNLLPLTSALLLSSLAAVVAAPATGCAPASEDTAGAESANTSEDLALAREMVSLLGSEENGKCSGCHAPMSAGRIKAWGSQMKKIETECLTGDRTPAEKVACLRSNPADATSAFSPRRLGLYAAGSTSPELKALFDAAFSPETRDAEFAKFVQLTAMPRGGEPLTEAEFAKLKGWVLRGMPQLDQAFLPADAGAPVDAGPAPACTPSITPELKEHIAAMKTAGWGARLADQTTPMFGCGGSKSPLECLGDLPDVTEAQGGAGVDQKIRQLHKQPLVSHWWVRSSSDGRFLGYGMNTSSKIIDLTKPGTPIKVSANYDPYFLPGNDGFAFAGVGSQQAIKVCRQSLLSEVAASASANPTITLTENRCASVGQNVYMSIGSALEGDRYFMTFGTHENDDGGWETTRPQTAPYGASASTTFTPMVNDGLSYKAERTVKVSHPSEGDMMLSHSSLIGALRFGGGGKQHGYRVRFIKPTAGGDAGLTINTPVGAEICLNGGKAGFSFDERFLVTHQYVNKQDPEQANLADKSANIIIVDLLTGKQVRITNSKTGEYALYPHFRADGWLYYVVRNMTTREEFAYATDIAIRMGAEQ